MNSIGPYTSRSHRGVNGHYMGGGRGRRGGLFGAGDDIFTTRGVTAPTPHMGGGARARGAGIGGYRDNHVSGGGGNSVNMYRGRSGGAVPALKRGYGDNYLSGGDNSYGGRLEADEFNFGRHRGEYDSLDDMGLDYPQISGRIRSAPPPFSMTPSSRRGFPQPQFEGAGGGRFGEQYGRDGGLESNSYRCSPRDYYGGADYRGAGHALGGRGFMPEQYYDDPEFGGSRDAFGGGGFMPELEDGLEHLRLDQDESVFGYLGIPNAKKDKSTNYIIRYINLLLRNRLMYHGGSVIHSALLNDTTIEALFPSRDILRAVVEKLSPITMKGDITVYVTYKPPVPTKNNPNMKPAVRRFPQSTGGNFPQSAGGRFSQAPRDRFPQAPRGHFPQAPRGHFPQAPRGRFPQAPRGRFPQAPRGHFPQAPRGRFPQAPRGRFPQAAGRQFPKPAVGRFPQSARGRFPPTTVRSFSQPAVRRFPQTAAAFRRQGATGLFRSSVKFHPGAAATAGRPSWLMQPGRSKLSAAGAAAAAAARNRSAMKYPRTYVSGRRPAAPMQPGRAKLGAAGATAAMTRQVGNVKGQKLTRMRGVFPDGVQPKSLVLVADDCRPFLSLTQLATTSGQQVLTGSSLDMAGFLQVIHNDSNMSKDGVLYVIIPSLAFFYKNLDALSVLEEEVEALRAAIAASLVKEESDDDAEPGDASSSTAVVDASDKKDSKSGKKESLHTKKPIKKRQLPLLREMINDFSQLVESSDQDILSKSRLSATGMTKVEEVEGLGQLPKLFARQMIHSALQLRASVRASTDNCEVVFCGFPTHHMDGSHAASLMAKKMPEPRAQALMLAMFSALRTYNEFAVNTWMLGGFKITNFNEANLPSSFLNVESTFSGAKDATLKDNKKADKEAPAAADAKPATQITTAESVAEESIESYGRHDDSAMEVDDSSSPTDSQSAGVLPLSFLAKCGWFAEDVDKASVMAGCTANVIKAVQKVANFQLHKGGFVPWGPIEAAEFDASVVPDIVKLSVENGIYTTSLAEDSDETLYECTKCLAKVGDLRAADAHAYTRLHYLASRRKMQRNAKKGAQVKSVLNGTATPTVAVPLSEDYLSMMVKFRIISVVESKDSAAGSAPHYQCLVCDSQHNNFDSTGLRFHVHYCRHRLNVNSALGLPNHRALVYQHENWPLVQSLLRHPPMDVVLLSDCRHANLLQRITKLSDRIHLLLVPDLFADTEASGMAALSEGLQMVQGRPALWLIVAGSDLFSSCPDLDLEQKRENVDKLSSQIISMQVLLRIHLPPSQRVVIAPLLPLHLLSETFTPLCTNNRIMDKLSSSLHCHVAQESQLVDLRKLYASLHYRVIQLHKSTSNHSNIRPIQFCVLRTPVSSITIDCEELPLMVTTPWQIAIQTMALGATYAAPALFLRSYEQAEPNVEELELGSMIQRVFVVGEEALCKSGPRSLMSNLKCIERKLSYVSEDFDFLGSKADFCEAKDYVAWYLPCPFPEVLFDKTDMDCCAAGDCPTVLQCWTYKGGAAVKDALIKIYRFMIELQGRLPTGNFITLLPIFPSTMVTCGATSDDASHASMHALVQEQPSNIFLTRDSPDDIASAVEDLGQGWLDLFLKTNHHYALRFEKDLFVRLELMELSHAVKNLPEVNKVWAVQWKDIFNSILKNYPRLNVELSDPICTRLGIELSSEHNTNSAQVNKTSAAPQTTATPATVNGDAAAASITVKKEAALSQLAESAAILSSD